MDGSLSKPRETECLTSNISIVMSLKAWSSYPSLNPQSTVRSETTKASNISKKFLAETNTDMLHSLRTSFNTNVLIFFRLLGKLWCMSPHGSVTEDCTQTANLMVCHGFLYPYGSNVCLYDQHSAMLAPDAYMPPDFANVSTRGLHPKSDFFCQISLFEENTHKSSTKVAQSTFFLPSTDWSASHL